MIYLSEKAMDVWKYFSAGDFRKIEDVYYFTGEELCVTDDASVFACIKLIKNNKSFDISFVTVRVKLSFGIGRKIVEEIIEEKILENENLKKEVLIDFFDAISDIEDADDILIDENILDFLKDFDIEPYYSYSEKNMLYCEFLNLFALQGKAVEGYYEGNLVLTEVALVNKSTGQVIKNFDNVNLCSNFYVEEDNDIDYMIECYLESMSQYDIEEKLWNLVK